MRVGTVGALFIVSAAMVAACGAFGADDDPPAPSDEAGAETGASGDGGSNVPETAPPVDCLTAQKPGNDETCKCEGEASGATQGCSLGKVGGASKCKPGTQTCGVGKDGTKRWGPCVNATVPALKETCFDDIDDDCDGVADNGCPCVDVPLCKGIDGSGTMLSTDKLLLDRTTAKFGDTVNALFLSTSPIGIAFTQFSPGGTCGGGGAKAACDTSGCVGWNVERRKIGVATNIFTQGAATYTISFRRGVTPTEQGMCTSGNNTATAQLVVTN